jgi:hypothetical protein
VCECEGERGVACSERSESAVKSEGRGAAGPSTLQEDLLHWERLY